jgi:hypothetical protein
MQALSVVDVMICERDGGKRWLTGEITYKP